MKRPRKTDPYNLQRFVDAQDEDNKIAQVFSELRAGKKDDHWMWYIFPQVEGLGDSEMSRAFAIYSLAEAKAYLAHPLLGTRLRKCSRLVNRVSGRSIDKIFEYPDNHKFGSSVTLFAHATSENDVFLESIQKYFDGEFDPLTVKWLANQSPKDKQ